MFLKALHDTLVEILKLERRFDPFFRPFFDAIFQEPLAGAVQAVINLGRKDEGVRLAEEKPLPNERL